MTGAIIYEIVSKNGKPPIVATGNFQGTHGSFFGGVNRHAILTRHVHPKLTNLGGYCLRAKSEIFARREERRSVAEPLFPVMSVHGKG
jgi:hypothetical protein